MVKYTRPAGDAENVNVRFPSGLIADVDEWVADKKFKSRSEFIIAATRYYLDHLMFQQRYDVMKIVEKNKRMMIVDDNNYK